MKGIELSSSLRNTSLDQNRGQAILRLRVMFLAPKERGAQNLPAQHGQHSPGYLVQAFPKMGIRWLWLCNTSSGLLTYIFQSSHLCCFWCHRRDFCQDLERGSVGNSQFVFMLARDGRALWCLLVALLLVGQHLDLQLLYLLLDPPAALHTPRPGVFSSMTKATS